MGRYYYDNKTETEDLRSLDAAWLRSQGYFKGFKGGSVTWTSSYGSKNSISLTINTDDLYTWFSYTSTDRSTGEKTDRDYKVQLTTTPCQFGGTRYWFTCPLYRQGKYCGRRVRILYMGQGLFGCRHCHNLTYSSRNVSQRFRAFSQALLAERGAMDLQQQLKRTHYRGKPTLKRRRLSKLWYKARNSDKLWQYLEKRL